MWKIIAPIFGYGSMGLTLLFFGETGVYILAAVSVFLGVFCMKPIGRWLDEISYQKHQRMLRQHYPQQRPQHRETRGEGAFEAEDHVVIDASPLTEQQSQRR